MIEFCCWLECTGLECGYDGCGGICGSCSDGFSCEFNLCINVFVVNGNICTNSLVVDFVVLFF